MIDGVAGLSLRAAAGGDPPPDARGGAEAGDSPAPQDDGGQDRHVARAPTGAARALARARSALAEPAAVVGEPDEVRGTLAEWRAWRVRLLALPRDESVHLALAIAEARIAKLRSGAGR